MPFTEHECAEVAWVFTPDMEILTAKRRKKNHMWKQNLQTTNWMKILPSQREGSCKAGPGKTWSDTRQIFLPHRGREPSLRGHCHHRLRQRSQEESHRRCQRGWVIKFLTNHFKDTGFWFLTWVRWSHRRSWSRDGAWSNAMKKPIFWLFWEMAVGGDKHRCSVAYEEAMKVILVRRRWQPGEMEQGRWWKGVNSESILKVPSTGFLGRVNVSVRESTVKVLRFMAYGTKRSELRWTKTEKAVAEAGVEWSITHPGGGVQGRDLGWRYRLGRHWM